MAGHYIIAAIVLWSLLVVIVGLMWWRMRGQSLADWLARDAREHEAVQRMLRLHPHGGHHAQITKWLRQLRKRQRPSS